MKKSAMLLVTAMTIVGLLLVPAISRAVPGNGNGDGDAGGNGNHYGWYKDGGDSDDNGLGVAQQVPEPFILFLLGSSLAGLVAIKKRLV